MTDNKLENVNVETHLMVGDPRQLVRGRLHYMLTLALGTMLVIHVLLALTLFLCTRQLQDVAKETHADQIVVGTHGRGILGRTLLGSVSTYLTQHSETPVTVVRRQDGQK